MDFHAPENFDTATINKATKWAQKRNWKKQNVLELFFLWWCVYGRIYFESHYRSRRGELKRREIIIKKLFCVRSSMLRNENVEEQQKDGIRKTMVDHRKLFCCRVLTILYVMTHTLLLCININGLDAECGLWLWVSRSWTGFLGITEMELKRTLSFVSMDLTKTFEFWVLRITNIFLSTSWLLELSRATLFSSL